MAAADDSSRSTFGLPWTATGGAVALAIIFAIARPQSTTVRTPPPSARDTATPAQFPAPNWRPDTARGARLLDWFLGRPISEYVADPGTRNRFVLRDVLIATLPDPHDTHLDWLWDSQLEAIIRAFESVGYLKDRIHFPNPTQLTAGWRNDLATSRSPLRAEPAVILFRGPRDSPTATQPLILLYLVGETPTSGIYKRPFRQAMYERDSLLRRSGLGDTSKPDTLRLLAPTFSGSSLSLRLLLDQSNPSPAVVQIVSGTATSYGNLAALTDSARSIYFTATIHSDASLQEVLRDSVLPKLRIVGSQVAILQEFSTQYGQSIHGADRKSRDDAFVSYPFPAGISRLRSEYQRHPELHGPERGQFPGLSTQPRVPLDLIDPSRPGEDLPVASRLTPPAVDLLLDQIARSLSESDIRLVGLLATDVRDKLFLAHELRRRMRDVQFFTYGANLLLLRADWTRAMHGALVLTTYPLIPELSDATAPKRTRQFSFGADAAIGTFNAALIQLGNRDSLIDYRTPLDQSRPGVSGGPPVSVTQPPVWVVTVGRTAFLPVATARATTAGKCYLAFSCAGIAAIAPRSDSLTRAERCVAAAPGKVDVKRRVRLDALTLVTVLVLVIFAWIAASVLDADVRHALRSALRFKPLQRLSKAIGLTRERRRERRPSIEVAPEAQEELRRFGLRFQEACFGFLLIAAILATLFPMAAVLELRWAAASGGAGQWQLRIVLFIAAGGIVALALAGGLLLDELLKQATKLGKAVADIGALQGSVRLAWWSELVGRSIVNIAALTLVVIAVIYAWEIAEHRTSCVIAGHYLAARLGRLDSLVSPLFIVIVSGLGFIAWGLWHRVRVRRLRYLVTLEDALMRWLQNPVPPTPDDPWQPTMHHLATRTRELRDRLTLLLPQRSAPIVAALVVGPLLWLVPQVARSLESLAVGVGTRSVFDLLLKGSLIATFVSTAWATYRLIVVWFTARRFLDHLAQLPVADALGRLGPEAGSFDLLAPGSVERYDRRNATMLPAKTRLDQLLSRLVTLGAPSGAAEATSSTAIAAANDYLKPLPRHAASESTLGTDDAILVGRLLTLLRVQWYERLRSDLRPSWKAGAAPAWQQAAEDLFSLTVLEYIAWLIRHLRHLAYFLLASLILTTVLLSSYPFYPQHLFKLAFFALVIVASGAMLQVLVQQNRDVVLSWISKTNPGRVTWDLGFVLKVFTAAGIPLLTLLSSEFPELRDSLLSWAKPLLDRLAQ